MGVRMGARFIKQGTGVDISGDFICVTQDDWKTNVCVSIVESKPLKDIRVNGIFTKSGDKMIPKIDEINMDEFSLLVGEIRQEARLRRVGSIFFETNNPTVFRLLKRLRFSTIAESKRTPCYPKMLSGVEFCLDNERLVMRSSV